MSLLFPLPARYADTGQLLAAQNAGDDGTLVTLLPESVFELLGTEAMHLIESPLQTMLYDKLRVTPVRFDPCLEQRTPDQHCRRAIRLVMQPVWPDGNAEDSYEVFDASLHLFYELDDDAFVKLLVDYQALIGDERLAQALYVHPILEREGLDGAFAQALRRLLIANANEASLIRMTFMATGRSGNNWFWGMFDRDDNGNWIQSLIPTLGFKGDGFERPPTLDPPPDTATEPFPFAMLWDSGVDRMTDAQLLDAAAQVYRIENPTITDSTNIRCRDCHLASRTLDYAFARRGLTLPEDLEYTPPLGQNVIVRDTDHRRRNNMHGFSYFEQQPSIMRRVVKDSAAVADFLASGAFAETLSPAARAAWDTSPASISPDEQ
ncbi:MAG: hypothetical protein AB7P03_05855 [Kofleriaceae bacterium]